jgi:hypothetical protein
MKCKVQELDVRRKFEGNTGRGTGESSVTSGACCDATPEVDGPVGARGGYRVGGNVTVRPNQSNRSDLSPVLSMHR